MPTKSTSFKSNIFTPIGLAAGAIALSLLLSLGLATLIQHLGLAKDYTYAREEAPSSARRP